MATQVIPTIGSDPFWTQTTTLDGTPYLLTFLYSQRETCFYLLLSTVDGDTIYGAVKLVCNWPLFAQCRDSRQPPGQFLVLSSTSDLSPPGLKDLDTGGRCQLVYIPAADLLEATGSETSLDGTVDVTNGSTAIAFSLPQTLSDGTVLVFSEQPGVPYVISGNVVNAAFATLTTPYTGPSGVGTLVESPPSGTLLAAATLSQPGQVAFGGLGSLDGLQWLLPMGSVLGVGYGSCPLTFSDAVTLDGDPTYTYQVALRFRGVCEQKTYTGTGAGGAVGVNASYFVSGGTPASDNWNIYKLQISSPAQTYYLNRGTSGNFFSNQIDYSVTLPVTGGATVTITANSIDSQEAINAAGSSSGPPISIPGIADPAQPYFGQFIQINILNVQ